MKTTLKIAVASAALIASAQSFALTDGQLLTQCKNLAKTELDNVERIKTSNIKNRKSGFSAKLRVRTADDSGTYLCSIARDAEPTLVRTDKPAVEEVSASS